MKRAEAERAVADSNLDRPEKLTLMMLLRRAHNDTLEVPGWRTPTLRQLAPEACFGTPASPDTRGLRRVLAHLASHGWVKYVAGQGHRSTYILLPGGVVPEACVPGACTRQKGGVGNPPFHCRKGGAADPPILGRKGGARNPRKGGHAALPPVSLATVGSGISGVSGCDVPVNWTEYVRMKSGPSMNHCGSAFARKPMPPSAALIAAGLSPVKTVISSVLPCSSDVRMDQNSRSANRRFARA